jgi:hypothetical protein
MSTASNTALRMNRTICLYFCQAQYDLIIQCAKKFRQVIDKAIEKHPELFPPEITSGYKMKEVRFSKKLNLKTRRIIISGTSYTIRPSFVMPYMTGFVQDVEKPLFLRKFAVPFWALSYCYGKNPMYWYRLELSLGRNSLLGTTIKSAGELPQHLSADEKHTRLLGNKTYIATTTGNGCVLGAGVTESASGEKLEEAYGVFKEEAECINPEYRPDTVNTDGWLPTQNAWKALFPQIVVLACLLHIFISIRDRSRKKYKELFREAATRLWDCFKAESKSSFSQRVRRLSEWCLDVKNEIPSVISDKIKKLRDNLPQFARAYDFPGAHRTSNMVDRLMQRMDRHLFSTQYFHGTLKSANLSIRAWALIQNFAPFNPWTVKQKCHVSSFERVNGFQYHENWLQNLLIAASLGGYRVGPPNPL